jgi:hypothetical protein
VKVGGCHLGVRSGQQHRVGVRHKKTQSGSKERLEIHLPLHLLWAVALGTHGPRTARVPPQLAPCGLHHHPWVACSPWPSS